MIKYEVVYGTGTIYLAIETVEVDEPTTDYSLILDMAIDQMEERGETNQFVSWEEIEDNGIGEDEYVTGGNHGLNLMHYGYFEIREALGEWD